MPDFRLRRGMHINFRGREYVIDQRLPNRDIKLHDVALDAPESVPEGVLLDALFDNQLEFLGDGCVGSLVQRKMAESFIEDISILSEEDARKKEFRRRHAYVKAIQVAQLTEFNATTLIPIIKRVHTEIKDDKRQPYWKTVYYRWFVPFILAGEDVRAYIPSYKKRGNRNPKFIGKRKSKGCKFSELEKRKAEEVAQVVDQVINEEFMNEQRLSVAEVYDRLEQRVAEINELRDVKDHLPLPHQDSIYDIVSKMDEYEKDRARHGKLYAEKKHAQKKRGPRPTRPLERVEIDHTKLDLFVVDSETRLPLGRPTITVAIDKYSRMIVGMHIGFDPAGYLSVMLCLLHAIKRKTYLKKDFPNVENEWNTYGIPEALVVDNGAEFHSGDLEDACLQLGTVILYNPVKHPWFKASIERFFGTQNRRLLHHQPGTTFSSIIDRGDYDPKKHAVISFDAFIEMAHIWIVDIYSQEIHKGLKDIPAQVWETGITTYPPNLPRRGQDLKVMIGQIERRKIGLSGIRLFNLTYNDDKLASLRRELKGKRAILKLNPDDLSIIYVRNHKDANYIPVLAEDQEYTKGLSLWQHRVILRYAHKTVRGHRNSAALRRAKKKIQAIVNNEWLKSGKSGARSRMSRWKRIHQGNLSRSLDMPTVKNETSDDGSGRELIRLVHNTTETAISDIGNALLINEGLDNQEDYSNVVHLAEESMANDTNLTLARRSQKPFNDILEAGSLIPCHQAIADGTTEVAHLPDSDLDMTGFNASYNLPARGDANE